MRRDIYWPWRFDKGRLFSTWWDIVSVISRTLGLTWFILAVELTLMWNLVGGVNDLGSVGQLIPFIIGLLGLVRSVHLVIMELIRIVCISDHSCLYKLSFQDMSTCLWLDL